MSSETNTGEREVSRYRTDVLILLATLAMTYLTFAKEAVLYQNETHGWRVWIYWVATNCYYPLLAINFASIVYLTWQRFRKKGMPLLLLGAMGVFFLNVALFSANNLLNVLRGRPIHGWHKGIGR